MPNTNLIGFDKEWRIISNLIRQDRLPHAILLTGLKSIGKSIFAKKIASEIFKNNFQRNSSNRDKSFSAHEEMIAANNFPDLHIIEDEKNNIAVEQIRLIIEKLSLKSYHSLGSVVIIDNAEKLSTNAANSLLKILEEPEQNKYFILISSQPQNVIETIKSRTQTFICGSRTPSELKTILQSLATDVSENELDEIAKILENSLYLLDVGEKDLQSKKEFRLIEKLNFLKSSRERILKILELENSNDRKSQMLQLFRSTEKDSNTKQIYFSLLLSVLKSKILASDPESSEALSSLLLNLIGSEKNIRVRHLDMELQISQFL